ncbi:MAG TPA: ABC transporter permease, partial [Cyclobacteriaceae bacterium]
MMKNKLFIVINVLGLGVAIACCIVSFLAYEYDATFDGIHKNGEKIYRVSAVREFENTLTRFGFAPMPLAEIVNKTISDVDESSRYVQSKSNFKVNNDLFASNLSYVDAEFFQLFSFDFISGDSNDLKDKSSLFISEAMATRLFNSPAEALGKNITQVYGSELKEIKVAGVFQEPAANSSFHTKEGSAYMNFENFEDEFTTIKEDDWKQESTLFVKINDVNRVQSVYKQLQSFIPNNNKVRDDFQVKEFALDPFTTMAHRDRDENVKSSTWFAPPSSAIIGSAIMGVLIVLIACFNLTNTAVAISSGRLKEIGIRKVMGSKRVQLVIQFILETTSICFLALLVGLGLSDLLIAGWNLMTANNIHLAPHYLDMPEFLVFLIGILVATGILAGSYPAFYISKFKPVNILKGKQQFGGTNYFTRILLGAQFAISLISIVSSIGFFQNAIYQRNYDLGFDARGSVVAAVNNQNEFDTYRNALESNPQVVSMAGLKSGIFSGSANEPVKFESKQAEVDIIEVGDNYLTTMDLKLTDGRDFIKDSETDRKESIIITQKMADLFGWTNPLGKEIIWRDTAKLFVI